MAKNKTITKHTPQPGIDGHGRWLNDKLEAELLEIRMPYRLKQRDLELRCNEQVRQIKEDCRREIEALELEYLERADNHRFQCGTRVGEEGSPEREGWAKAHDRRMARETLARDVRTSLETQPLVPRWEAYK